MRENSINRREAVHCALGLVPVHLKQGVKHPVMLVGDDVQKATADGVLKELTLRLSLANVLSEEDKITYGNFYH